MSPAAWTGAFEVPAATFPRAAGETARKTIPEKLLSHGVCYGMVPRSSSVGAAGEHVVWRSLPPSDKAQRDPHSVLAADRKVHGHCQTLLSIGGIRSVRSTTRTTFEP